MLVLADIFNAGLAFAQIGVGAVDQKIDRQFQLRDLGILGHADDTLLEIALGDGTDNGGSTADGLAFLGDKH